MKYIDNTRVIEHPFSGKPFRKIPDDQVEARTKENDLAPHDDDPLMHPADAISLFVRALYANIEAGPKSRSLVDDERILKIARATRNKDAEFIKLEDDDYAWLMSKMDAHATAVFAGAGEAFVMRSCFQGSNEPAGEVCEPEADVTPRVVKRLAKRG